MWLVFNNEMFLVRLPRKLKKQLKKGINCKFIKCYQYLYEARLDFDESDKDLKYLIECSNCKSGLDIYNSQFKELRK